MQFQGDAREVQGRKAIIITESVCDKGWAEATNIPSPHTHLWVQWPFRELQPAVALCVGVGVWLKAHLQGRGRHRAAQHGMSAECRVLKYQCH